MRTLDEDQYHSSKRGRGVGSHDQMHLQVESNVFQSPPGADPWQVLEKAFPKRGQVQLAYVKMFRQGSFHGP